MSKRQKPIVLVVDDETEIRSILAKFLDRLGYGVEEAGTGAEALTKGLATRPDAILLDQKLPDFDGYEVYMHLAQYGLRVPTALMSGFPGVSQVAKLDGICHFLPKPIAFDNLGAFMSNLMATKPAKQAKH